MATFRNTGTTPWPASSLQLVRNVPAGHPADPLTAPPTATRLVALKAGSAVVRPGETVTVSLAVDASRVPIGAHDRSYRLRLGSGAAFGASVVWKVAVRAPLPGSRR